ncbi:MAG: hypothetical protein AMJ62_08855 [Myxococcales bacterium SG8_38]|nr:MAG: hypothetical protein AMJ62_08855 [Myxococcales bacterium SG8_38]
MQTLSVLLAAVVACVASLEGQAWAQQTSPGVQTQPAPAPMAPPPQYSLYRPYDERDLEDAKERSRVVRNGLIGTSAAFALGAILGGIGLSQCSTSTNADGTEDWVCNNAGDVLAPLGGTIAGLSAIGVLTTGIMLGVRNKHVREIEREIRRRYGTRRLHWDEKSGSFVF